MENAVATRPADTVARRRSRWVFFGLDKLTPGRRAWLIAVVTTAVLLTVMKAGNASTLAVVDGVRTLLPAVEATLPPELKISL